MEFQQLLLLLSAALFGNARAQEVKFCPKGWLMNFPYCYLAVPLANGVTSWGAAEAECMDSKHVPAGVKGVAHLATISSMEENEWIAENLLRHHSSVVWIGGWRWNSTWRWIEDNSSMTLWDGWRIISGRFLEPPDCLVITKRAIWKEWVCRDVRRSYLCKLELNTCEFPSNTTLHLKQPPAARPRSNYYHPGERLLLECLEKWYFPSGVSQKIVVCSYDTTGRWHFFGESCSHYSGGVDGLTSPLLPYCRLPMASSTSYNADYAPSSIPQFGGLLNVQMSSSLLRDRYFPGERVNIFCSSRWVYLDGSSVKWHTCTPTGVWSPPLLHLPLHPQIVTPPAVAGGAAGAAAAGGAAGAAGAGAGGAGAAGGCVRRRKDTFAPSCSCDATKPNPSITAGLLLKADFHAPNRNQLKMPKENQLIF